MGRPASSEAALIFGNRGQKSEFKIAYTGVHCNPFIETEAGVDGDASADEDDGDGDDLDGFIVDDVI